MKHVYLDNASTTPLDTSVLKQMLPFLTDHYGNASSVHGPGRKARYAVEDSRERVARLLNCEPAEIIFTSGGTEADNVAVASLRKAGAIMASKAEHKALLAPLNDAEVIPLEVDEFARVMNPTEQAMSSAKAMTVMLVNNETGSINRVTEFASLCHARDVVIHTDAVQAAGLFELDVDQLGIDMMTISAHKIGGPKGVGVLYVRGGTSFTELIRGGSQERGRRGGTENVAAVVGLAAALEAAAAGREEWQEKCKRLRQRLVDLLHEEMPIEFVVNSAEGADTHILNIAFPPIDGKSIDGEMLILNMDVEGVSVSSGSACTSGTVEPSHVLLAAGLDPATAAASLRFSFGKQNTEADIDFAVSSLEKCISRMTARTSKTVSS